MTRYEVSGRRAPLMVVGLLFLLLVYAGVLTLVLTNETDGQTILDAVLGATGGVLLGVIVIFLYGLRKFAWTIHARELEVEERGRVFTFAPNRHARIAFTSLKALRRIEAGQEVIAEAETETGARHHLPCKMEPRPGSLLPAADEAGHRQFLDALNAAITQAGLRPPRLTQGLGFWQRIYGIGVLIFLLLLTASFSSVAIWAIADGAELRGGAAKGAPLIALLPLGAGWLLWRAIKRRRAVLKDIAKGQD